jgi:hypothetical protein
MEAPKTPAASEELDFLNLVLMLGTTASVELGAKKAPGAPAKANYPRARQIINMLDVLKKKTEGRRSPQEEQVLGSVLDDLRAKYVKAAGLDQENPELGQLGRLAAQAYQRTRKP